MPGGIQNETGYFFRPFLFSYYARCQLQKQMPFASAFVLQNPIRVYFFANFAVQIIIAFAFVNV
jgi:hypothetical protein